MIDNIHGMALSDWRIKVHEIVEATDISQGTQKNKRNRVVDYEAILALFRRNLDEFLRWYTIHGDPF